MLNASNVIHQGLGDIYRSGVTSQNPPDPAEWSACLRRMQALNLATNLSHAALPAYGISARPGGAYQFASLPSGGSITFDWSGMHALDVDWA